MFDINSASNLSPSGCVFTRNPIRVGRSAGPSFDGDSDISVSVDTETVFRGHFRYPETVDISEIVDSSVPYFPEADTARVKYAFFCQVETEAELRRRECLAWIDGGDEDPGFIAIPGGLSPEMLRSMGGEDPFVKRFLNPGANFFFTIRPDGWKLIIRETEICPLYFINDVSGCRITLKIPGTDHTYESPALPRGVYAFDLERARKYFFSSQRILTPVLDVWKDGRFSCRIIIEQAAPSRWRTIVRFRNSLGVFECIEFTGEPLLRPEWDSDNASFRAPSSFGGFLDLRLRLTPKSTIEINTGPFDSSRLTILKEMIASDEVYISDGTSNPLRAVPSIEDFGFPQRPDGVMDFKVAFKVSEDNTFVTATNAAQSSYSRRIFSKQFSKHFN